MNSRTLLFARQPILDRALHVAGYELLFRDAAPGSAEAPSPEGQTADVVTRALLDIGLDALVGAHKAWINISRDFLVQRAFSALPPDRFVLEVLETVCGEPEVIAALREARAAGFEIALDDFVLAPHTVDLVAECDAIKLDCLGCSPDDMPRIAAQFAASGRRLLAEKIETRELHEAAHAAGFELFQGYFFTRPAVVRGARIAGDRLNTLRMVTELNDPNASIERVVELVQSDVALAYRMLRFVNSAAIGRPVQITRLRDAVTMLGLDRVRACATLLLLGSMSDKPRELAATALVRARYCQLLADSQGKDPQEHFVVGLFSVLDAFLDEPMSSVIQRLPLSSELSAALVEHSGELGNVLERALACERADWQGATVEDLDEGERAASYVAALEWANQALVSLDEP
jgi:EAL and modified HD-GYP domain-containing signal transduction protein